MAVMGEKKDQNTAIEVTPAMIEVGADILSQATEIGPYTAQNLAEEIFRAMLRAYEASTHEPPGPACSSL